MYKTPTPQQLLILEYQGNCVVTAAPGSGKTFVLSQKIKSALAEIQDWQGIAAISFTNKASNELKSRSLSFGENPKKSFFGTLDKFFLSQIIIPFIHQLFNKEVDDYDVKTIEDVIYISNDDKNFLKEKIIKNRIYDIKDFIGLYQKHGIILIETVGYLGNFIFDKLSSCRRYIKARFKFVFVDEYQDSGEFQHQVFLKIKDLGITCIAVGDGDQSIFEFAQKSDKFLIELTKNPSFRKFDLSLNHRCHPSIIAYSNALMGNYEDKNISEDLRVFFWQPPVNEENFSQQLDNFIGDLFKHHPNIKPFELALLSRTNAFADRLNSSLVVPRRMARKKKLENDISISVWSGIFYKILCFIYDETYLFHDVFNLYKPIEYFSKREMRSLSSYKNNFIEIKLNTELLSTPEFITLCLNFAKFISPLSYNDTSIRLLKETLSDTNELQDYLPLNQNEIIISTLHSAKGLEYKAVILLETYKYILPKAQPRHNNNFKNLDYPNWKQDLNLHYVGITRAIEYCFIINPMTRINANNEYKKVEPSEFLLLPKLSDLRINKP